MFVIERGDHNFFGQKRLDYSYDSLENTKFWRATRAYRLYVHYCFNSLRNTKFLCATRYVQYSDLNLLIYSRNGLQVSNFGTLRAHIIQTVCNQ